jgi:hypothetical protein
MIMHDAAVVTGREIIIFIAGSNGQDQDQD